MDDKKGKGTVLYKRSAQTYFLSSPEIVFAAIHQNRHPSPCRYSDTGKFGSKFVTVVVSGEFLSACPLLVLVPFSKTHSKA